MSANHQILKKILKRNYRSPSYRILLDYEKYIKRKKLVTNKKYLVEYKGAKIPLTKKQINVLSLIGRGFSNSKIAKELYTKENTVKQIIYRLIKKLETNLYEHLDRFNLVILAQKLDLNNKENF